jgi:GNAT superfamily N-acetyltransferase
MLPTVPVKAPLVFRRARNDDTDELSAIAWAAKAHWGYPVSWLEAWRTHLTITRETLLTQEVWLAEGAGEAAGIVGFFSVRPSAEGWQLEHLWVRPAWIRRGWGRQLMAAALKRAQALGADSLRIIADPHAEGFYRTLGAVRTGVDRYYLFGTVLRELPLMELEVA